MKDGSGGGDGISRMENGNKLRNEESKLEFGSSGDVLWLRTEGVSGHWDESGSQLFTESPIGKIGAHP